MMKLFYSPDLFDLLSTMDNDVARFLISLDDTYVTDVDMTLINIDKNNLGHLTFARSSKINYPNAEKSYITNSFFIENNLSKLSNNSIKVGKFVQKFQKFSNKEIEDFVNLFKSSIEVSNETIELVSGEDIRHWYLNSNYYSDISTLGSSCMRHEHTQEYLDIYTKNPETCKLLIIKRNNKLVARALVWKIHKVKAKGLFKEGYYFSKKNINIRNEVKNMLSNSEYFMDKCYYITDHYHESLKKYAKKNNWIIRKNDYLSYVYNDQKKYTELNLNIQIKLKPLEFKHYPYMDTFSRYNSKNGILYNDRSYEKIGHILTSTYGSFRESKTIWEYIKYNYLGW